jgi:uncharacterized protein YigE (DUF2233 family)
MLSPLIQLCFVSLLCLAVPATAQAVNCRNTSFEGAAYIACSFDPAKQDLRLFWRGADDKPYLTFAALARDLKSKGKSLRFAMNGGMYQDDFSPVGLYVENGRELTRANTATLTGAPSAIPNFFKKPNGVFYIGNGAAGILETGRFLAERPDANFATQSGPMLIIDGAIHPAFIVNSTDRGQTVMVCIDDCIDGNSRCVRSRQSSGAGGVQADRLISPRECFEGETAARRSFFFGGNVCRENYLHAATMPPI